MTNSGDDPGDGIPKIRAWVWIVAFLCAALVGVFAFTGGVETQPEPSPSGDSSDVGKLAAHPSSPGPNPKPAPSPDLPTFDADPPPLEPPEFEVAVFQTDLTVILLSRPTLGAISVERYDRDGNPTGEALKPGTQVQIPDPDQPGNRIHFTVP